MITPNSQFFPKFQAILQPGITMESARIAFRSIGDIPCLHPTNGPAAKPMKALIESDNDANHFLNKSPDDVFGRASKHNWDETKFLQDRAEMVDFIPVVLKDPKAVYESKKFTNRFVYVSLIAKDTYFIVVMDQRSKRLDFVTAFPCKSDYWHNQRTFMKRTAPRTHGATSTKAKKRLKKKARGERA